MVNIAHDLFLLMNNLTQLKSRKRIITVFTEAINSFHPGFSIEFIEGETSPARDLIDLSTSKKCYGFLKIKGTPCNVSPEFLPLFQNAIQMVAIILEKLHQEELLSDEKMILQSLIDEKIASLKESEKKFRSYVDFAPDGIFVVDEKGNFTDINNSACKITGYSREELLCKNIVDLYSEDSIEAAKKHFQKVLTSGRTSGELSFIKKDGIRRYWAIDAVKLSETRFLGFARDITEKKLAEEEQEKLRNQLFHAQKMESVGRLAGGVAHDFNNMLGVIIGHVELAMEKIKISDNIYNNLEAINNAAMRSIDLTRQLLAFARKQTIAPKLLDLNDAISGMLKMLRRLIGEDINLMWMPCIKPCMIMIDPAQVDQILANLCVNARDSITGTGNISIETKHRTAGHGEGVSAGEYVMLSVSDNGSGMTGEIIDHIFEPFFTTKEVGKGTGLGLATVYGIVKQNNGFINVYSEPAMGSTFNICFPLVTAKSDDIQNQEEAKLPEGKQENILLVEDEEDLLEMTTLMLEKLGYNVLAAREPCEAIKMADACTGTIDLLITDVVMPGMNGRELYEKLNSGHKNIKCLFMSGYTGDVIAEHGVIPEGVNFIQKPFFKKDLALKLRNVLD
ncbi:MAG: PAS domain S-box protein [Candidatus Eremiobacterota bacterium]